MSDTTCEWPGCNRPGYPTHDGSKPYTLCAAHDPQR